jgi:hypothetical protein
MSVVLSLVLLTSMAVGQQVLDASHENESDIQEVASTVTATTHPVERIVVPSYADLNCAGFISRNEEPRSTFVAGGLNSPNATKFITGNVVYLSGSHFKDGDQLTLVRELRDPNEYEIFAGQRKLIAATGQPYAELGQAHIVDTRQGMAIAHLDFTCEAVMPGDLAVPFINHQKISYRSPQHFDIFAPANGKTTGRIVMAKDFDGVLGTGAKVYLTVGSDQAVKVGDYFRVVRTYEEDLRDPVDSLSFKASVMEDTQKYPPATGKTWSRSKGPSINVNDMPRHSVGELIVLSTTPTSATAMVTFALQELRVGDRVELEPQVATAQAVAPAATAAPAAAK